MTHEKCPVCERPAEECSFVVNLSLNYGESTSRFVTFAVYWTGMTTEMKKEIRWLGHICKQKTTATTEIVISGRTATNTKLTGGVSMINLFNSEEHEHDWEEVTYKQEYEMTAQGRGIVVVKEDLKERVCTVDGCERRQTLFGHQHQKPQEMKVIPWGEFEAEWEEIDGWGDVHE